MEGNYKDLFDLMMNGPDSRATIDRRMHTVVTDAGEVVDASEIITHYVSGDHIDYTVAIQERGIVRHAKSYEDAIRIVEHYLERANAGASVSELDSII